jgi:hypothetical protein
MSVIEVPQKVDYFFHRAHLAPIGGNNVEQGWPWLLAGLSGRRVEDLLERICTKHHIARQCSFLELRLDLLLKAIEDLFLEMADNKVNDNVKQENQYLLIALI